MKFGLNDQEIQQIQSVFAKYPAIHTVLVFGSRAINTFQPASDIDLALKGDINFGLLAQVKGELEELPLPYFFDVVNYHDINTTEFKDQIDKHGKIFYLRGWEEVKLGDVAEILKLQWKSGDEEQKYIGLEHINQEELTINGFGCSNKLESNKFYFKTGDILFGKLRPYFRKVWLAKFDGVCSTDIWVIKARENNDQKFLFYFVANPVFIDKSMGASTGTHMPRADWNFLINTKWYIPSLPEQHAIAAVLSSLDDKIELLREQNKTLEATAQAVFKEWFVNFNFPGATGKMIDSELGEIPEGWKIGKLGEEFEIIMGQSPDGKSYNEQGEGMIFFQGRTDFQERFPKTRLFTTEPKRIAEKFDTLVSVRAPVGDINVAFEQCCIGRGLGAVRSKYKSYALYKIKPLKEVFENFETEGTIFGSINKDSFLNIEVIIPCSVIIDDFEKTINPIDQKIFNNSSQIQTISNLRDVLLPKLMNGEVKVRMITNS
ncbi:MAG: hypothetical protein A2X78_00100 [Gammaproteobacteria bacterium GWE2_37_16]|nr:MAG: hypothetical protein A2X78_00100 [Gammaproteobacteria bacterium GWE2_37_16]